MTLLRDAGSELTIAEIAGRLDVHPNTARFHLESLVRSGHVEQVDGTVDGPGRPPLAFRARRGMDPDGPRSYRLLAGILAAELGARPDAVARAQEAGRAWGADMIEQPAPDQELTDGQATARLLALLDDLGFAPEQRAPATDRQLALRHCPFLDLVETGDRLVCSLHLGLMQGAMTTLGTPLTVEWLDPFVEPDLCVAHLRANAPGRVDGSIDTSADMERSE
ncbi:helix-turn-helix transcriptional regulator [Actinomycetospora rhizophila]|uniref:Helix-turn-helix transcriptional regulator n=1 Tax=Actinomycetospora rhizophila TaxID=1416876 RepID=A0ABV9Z9H6_9PSEU